MTVAPPRAQSVIIAGSAMQHHYPICRKPTNSEVDADFPFCSERCRLLDLGNWSAERYVVSQPVFDEEDAAEQKSLSNRSTDSAEDDK
jgi:endogenous inhibitor of DNA gyrase (YacG/DUF329 family)